MLIVRNTIFYLLLFNYFFYIQSCGQFLSIAEFSTKFRGYLLSCRPMQKAHNVQFIGETLSSLLNKLMKLCVRKN